MTHAEARALSVRAVVLNKIAELRQRAVYKATRWCNVVCRYCQEQWT